MTSAGWKTPQGGTSMADGFKEFMEAEICMMKRDIGPDENADSEYFTRKAIEWIEKNAAGFRMQWDRKKKKIVGRTKTRKEKTHDVG
jgi:hypothetical protein